MPLVRYEIPNEHSLANPQLYRSAAKDDPEGLLEGVAMAGLVGIVRQLGDLAEFAAEVFRDLHEEIMATASRGHDLSARVQQLEAEMPVVEKALLSETNQLRFAYAPGAEWHASVRNYQNLCTQGDLPQFIRNSYEECRGPPRLFLLDKFDVAGAGACLKRYTDPSFFRTEWASSELMKAERAQRDKRARREKKKGRRRRNAEGKDRFSHELSKELMHNDQVHSRMWHQPLSGRLDDKSAAAEDNQNYNENLNAISRHLAEARGDVRGTRKTVPGFTQEAPVGEVVDVPQAASEVSNPPQTVDMNPPQTMGLNPPQTVDLNPPQTVDLKPPQTVDLNPPQTVDLNPPQTVDLNPPQTVDLNPPQTVDLNPPQTVDLSPPQTVDVNPPQKNENASTYEGRVRSRRWERNSSGSAYKDEAVLQEREAGTAVVDDAASEGDQFLDALTTMGSEADTDSEPGLRQEVDADGEADRNVDATEGHHSRPQGDRRAEVPEVRAELPEVKAEVPEMRAEVPEVRAELPEVRVELSDPTSTYQLGKSFREQSQPTLHETLKASGFYHVSATDQITTPVEQPAESRGESSYQKFASEETLAHVEKLQETFRDDSNSQGIQRSIQEQEVGSVEPSSTSQEDLRSPGVDGTSTGETGTSLAEQPTSPRPEVAFVQDLSHDSKVTSNGDDANGKSGTPGHVRRLSTTSISSQSSRKSSRSQWQVEPRENFAPRSKLDASENGQKGPTKPSEQRAAQNISGTGSKVSKMVAAFERGSLEEIHNKEPLKYSHKIPPASSSLESFAGSVRNSSVDAPNAAAQEDREFEHRLPHGSVSPLVISPSSVDSISTNDSRLLVSPAALRVKVETTSVSSHVSVASSDSPPESPSFSALHSPISPSRTRNILSSPDSQSLHIASELLSPGSPTFVPILALSPTSQRLRPPPFTSLDHGDHQTMQSFESPLVKNLSSLTSSSGSPAELPSTPISEVTGSTTPPPTIPETVDGTTAPNEFNHRSPPAPHGSPDDFPGRKPPAASSDLVPSVDIRSEDSKPHRGTPIFVPEEIHYSNADPEVRPAAGARVREDSSFAMASRPQIKADDTTTSTVTRNDSPGQEHPKTEFPSSLQSSLLYGAGGHIASSDNRDRPLPAVPEASNGMPARVSASEIKRDRPPAAFTPGHKRVPSQTSVEGTVREPLSSSSKPSKDPLVVVTPSRRVPTSQGPVVPVVKAAHDVRSPSQSSQTMHSHPASAPIPVPVPHPQPKHRRFPSFPPSETTAMELASAASSSSSSRRTQHRRTSSAIPGKMTTGVHVPGSKQVYGLQFPAATLQALHALPPPTPPSKLQQDFLYQQPTPSRNLHEPSPPPPPMQTPEPVSGTKLLAGVDGQDKLLNAITSHDKSSLKKVKTMQNPSLRKGDDRSHLLEQIRARSFNLRHTVVEKHDPPLGRPVTNINVAAILEKANAIRQAFAGSDEDDDGEDDWDDT